MYMIYLCVWLILLSWCYICKKGISYNKGLMTLICDLSINLGFVRVFSLLHMYLFSFDLYKPINFLCLLEMSSCITQTHRWNPPLDVQKKSRTPLRTFSTIPPQTIIILGTTHRANTNENISDTLPTQPLSFWELLPIHSWWKGASKHSQTIKECPSQEHTTASRIPMHANKNNAQL